MLQNVRNFWIKGVLEQSLYAVARLELGLITQPDAVEDVWNVLVQRPDQMPQPLPPDTRISTAFDEFGNALLILGAPGTGKTTLLLELTKDLLERAEHDPNHPLPVVFNLSSWAARQPPLADWLVDELCERYQVPRKHAQIWIDKDLILPLLDGLDEVAPACRSACAEAINEFRQQHGLVPMAVCSRLADYEALTVKLRLQGALVVQSLTRQQIDHYLAQAGKPLAGVWAALQDDNTLWELLDTPLMLSIATLAYQGRLAAEMQAVGTLEERRKYLFAAYTDAMFKRRGKAAPYSRQQTDQWLVWLATAMAQHDQSIFYIEWMQPDWLPTRQQQRGVTLGVAVLSGLVGGLVGELLFGLIGRLPGDLIGRPPGELVGRLVFGLGGGLVGGLVGMEGRGMEGSSSKPIQPIEMLQWSWPEKEKLVGGLVGGLLFGLVVVLVAWLVGRLPGGLGGGLLFGLPSGLVVGLLSVLDKAIVTSTITTRIIPNEGIRRSMRNTLLWVLVFGLGGGLVSGLLYELGLWAGRRASLRAGQRAGRRAARRVRKEVVSLAFGILPYASCSGATVLHL